MLTELTPFLSRILDVIVLIFEVEGIFNELYLDNDIVVDDMVEILKENDIDALKQEIKDYFGILESKGA